MFQLLRQFRSAFLIIGFFSLVINLLMLAPPLYMLQIFSRVLSSRSNETLAMLFLLVLFALMIAGWLDASSGATAESVSSIGAAVAADSGGRDAMAMVAADAKSRAGPGRRTGGGGLF
ncbi:MAG: hypothetical protein HC889_04750 [Synechococcaceae cyanobacterium SM1_2_3]|nr:hypothetical protein [Synechococcaceae cyanobacterium SM1_2_3]